MAFEIAHAARSGPALLGASRLITIDGPAGSGKSTLAHLLMVELGQIGGAWDGGGSTAAHRIGSEVGGAEETDSPGGTWETAEICGSAGSGKAPPANEITGRPSDVATIHLDDLYEGWTGLNSTLFNRLEAWIMLPLANSLAARFLAYDWAQDRFTRWVAVRPHPYVIIEGVGAGDAVTSKWATTRVWLDVPNETGRLRGLARDSAGQSESTASQELRERWSDWQRLQAEYFASSRNRAAADFCVDTTRP